MDKLEWAKYYKTECEKKGKEIKRLKKEIAGLYTEAEYRQVEKERDEWEQKYLNIT